MKIIKLAILFIYLGTQPSYSVGGLSKTQKFIELFRTNLMDFSHKTIKSRFSITTNKRNFSTSDDKFIKINEPKFRLPKKESIWGKKIGVLTPATNLTVENELWSMKVNDATIATSRILIDKVNWDTDNDLRLFVEGVIKNIPDAVKQVEQVQPDALLLGISISNLWGGLKSNNDLKSKIKQQTGLDLYTPVDAMKEALTLFNAKKIGVVTPYPEIADKKVVEFYEELGIKVLAQKGLRCRSAREIGEVQQKVIKEALEEVCVHGIDAITILGTDLKAAKLASEVETWLNIPTISVNTSTWWLTLRKNGIKSKVRGYGSLLENY